MTGNVELSKDNVEEGSIVEEDGMISQQHSWQKPKKTKKTLNKTLPNNLKMLLTLNMIIASAVQCYCLDTGCCDFCTPMSIDRPKEMEIFLWTH